MIDTPENAAALQDLQQPMRELHRRFHALVEPLRPDLYRYFLRLTGSPFDAEDLVQETLVRAFGRLNQFYQPLETRKYVFRIATNLWIDQVRRGQRLTFLGIDHELPGDDADLALGASVREALRRMVEVLEPRQRVAVLLKDVFEFPIDEIAEFLETTPGAVKALLHRGRERLNQARSMPLGVPPEPDSARWRLAEAYAQRLSAQDWAGIAALLRADATVTIIGVDEEHGRDYIRRTSLADAEKDLLPGHRAEMVVLDGEPLVLWLYRPDDGPEAIVDVHRFETDGESITHVRQYWFCPDTVREVGRRLGRRAEPNGTYTA